MTSTTRQDVASTEPIPLCQGRYWDEFTVGQRFRTIRRTIHEADLCAFIGLSGMFSEGFLNGASRQGVMGARPVPGALTYLMIEGLVVPTLLAGTGLALLESRQVMHKPVQVGDTIDAVVEITELRPTRRPDRGVVGSRISIANQHGDIVMTCETKRMLIRRPAPSDIEGGPA